MSGYRYRPSSGFSRQSAQAFWITCDLCGESDLFFGQTGFAQQVVSVQPFLCSQHSFCASIGPTTQTTSKRHDDVLD